MFAKIDRFQSHLRVINLWMNAMAEKKDWESELDDSSESDNDLEELLIILSRRRPKKRKRSVWVRPIFSRRREQGEYNLLQELRLSDPESHFRYLRMSRERFDCLVALVSSLLYIVCFCNRKQLAKTFH